MGEMKLQRILQPEGVDNRERKPSERGTASYAGRSSIAAGNQAALLTGSICDITGNQQILQLYPQGTYGNSGDEKKRLSASHGGADTSKERFQFEHVIGFAVVNPTELTRNELSFYEDALFAYAEIYLAHRIHIGTGRASNYTMPGELKKPEEVEKRQQPMQQFMQRFGIDLENFIQSNCQRFAEEAQLTILAYMEQLGQAGEKKNKKTFMEFLHSNYNYLDHWFSFIQDLSMEFLELLKDLSKSEILENDWIYYIQERCMNQLLSQFKTDLDFRPSTKFPYTGIPDRGFKSDQDYREHQRAAVYEDQHIGNAVQLNQLGYALIYDYIICPNPERHIEVQIANDSFLYMVENMLSVDVIDLEGQPDPQTGMPPDKITKKEQIQYKTILVTPQERCEMILARLAMVHRHWPGVLEEALVRFYIIGGYRDPSVRMAVLDTLNSGAVNPVTLKGFFEQGFLHYFYDSPLYIRILQDFLTRRIEPETDVDILSVIYDKIPEMPVKEKLDTMSSLITVFSQENEAVKQMCNKLFGGAPDHYLLQALGVSQPVLAGLNNVVAIIKRSKGFSPSDRSFWFVRYICSTSFEFCHQALMSANEFSLEDFWGIVVEHFLSLPECDDLQMLIELFPTICSNQLLENQLEAILNKIWALIEVDEDAMDELRHYVDLLLRDLNSASAEHPSIKLIISHFYSVILNESENDPDGGSQLQERWKMLGLEEVLNNVLSGEPELIVNTIIMLEGHNSSVLLPALLNQLKDVQLMATICASALKCIERIQQQAGDDTARGLINLLFIRLEDLGTENRIELERLYYLITDTLLDMHDALLATVSCLVAQIKMEPGEAILDIASVLKQVSEKSGLTDDPEMMNDFAELIIIGSRMKNKEVYQTLIQTLMKDDCELWEAALITGDGASVVELILMLIKVDMPWSRRLLSLAISNCQDVGVLGLIVAAGDGFGKYWDDIIWALVRHPRSPELITQNEIFLQCIMVAAKKAEGRDRAMHELRQLILQYGSVETLPEDTKEIFKKLNLITV